MVIFEIVMLSLFFIPLIALGFIAIIGAFIQIFLIKSAGEIILRYGPICEVCKHDNFEVTIIEAIPTIDVEYLVLSNDWQANEVTSIIQFKCKNCDAPPFDIATIIIENSSSVGDTPLKKRHKLRVIHGEQKFHVEQSYFFIKNSKICVPAVFKKFVF